MFCTSIGKNGNDFLKQAIILSNLLDFHVKNINDSWHVTWKKVTKRNLHLKLISQLLLLLLALPTKVKVKARISCLDSL